MNPLDTHLIDRALALAEQAQGEAASAREFAVHHLGQVQERYGEDSTEFEQADTFCRITFDLDDITQTHLADLRKAKPTRPATDS